MGVRTVIGDVAPSRGSLSFAWAVSIVVFSLTFVATLVVVMLLLSPVALHGDLSNPLNATWDPWASWVGLGAALLAGAAMITAGGTSGLVWKWAELRVQLVDGTPAPWLRRLLRPLLLGALVMAALALLHSGGGPVVAVLLVGIALGTALAAPDRRGVMERLTGLRDVAFGQVPAPAEESSESATA